MRPALLAALLLACAPPQGGGGTNKVDNNDIVGPGFGGTDGGSTGGSTLTEGGVITCDAPEQRTALGPFEEADLGRAWTHQRPAEMPPIEQPRSGAGLVVADLNGDHRLDVFLPNLSACMLFLGQPDSTLADESDRLPLPSDNCNGWGASAADYDQDGDLDLYVAVDALGDRLLQNDGTAHFTDVTAASGIAQPPCGSRSASWGDMDGDGDLDLFVALHRVVELDADPCDGDTIPPTGNPNSLYENLGGTRFVDRSERLSGPTLLGHSFIGAWHNADGDNDQDIYVVNDFGSWDHPSNLYLNDGDGNFTALPATDGLELSVCGMGVGIADVNEDQHPDYVVSNIGRLHLMLSTGAGSWYDAASARGLVPDTSRSQYASWGVELVDINNDGRVDVVAPFGPTEDRIAAGDSDGRRQPDAIFLQDADGDFTDVALDWGVADTAQGRGQVIADFNGDGWLDIFRRDFREGPTKLWRARCGAESWVSIKLQGHAQGYGARVEIDIGDRTLTRWHGPTSTGLGSSGPATVHFGLGEHDHIDALRVYWADGGESRHRDITARQHLIVRQLSDTGG